MNDARQACWSSRPVAADLRRAHFVRAGGDLRCALTPPQFLRLHSRRYCGTDDAKGTVSSESAGGRGRGGREPAAGGDPRRRARQRDLRRQRRLRQVPRRGRERRGRRRALGEAHARSRSRPATCWPAPAPSPATSRCACPVESQMGDTRAVLAREHRTVTHGSALTPKDLGELFGDFELDPATRRLYVELPAADARGQHRRSRAAASRAGPRPRRRRLHRRPLRAWRSWPARLRAGGVEGHRHARSAAARASARG